MQGMKGRRYKLCGLKKEMELVVWKRRWSWWCRKGDGVGGVGVMVK